jgi:hypothetical protein
MSGGARFDGGGKSGCLGAALGGKAALGGVPRFLTVLLSSSSSSMSWRLRPDMSRQDRKSEKSLLKKSFTGIGLKSA